jgi:hypothetical protein
MVAGGNNKRKVGGTGKGDRTEEKKKEKKGKNVYTRLLLTAQSGQW